MWYTGHSNKRSKVIAMGLFFPVLDNSFTNMTGEAEADPKHRNRRGRDWRVKGQGLDGKEVKGESRYDAKSGVQSSSGDIQLTS